MSVTYKREGETACGIGLAKFLEGINNAMITNKEKMMRSFMHDCKDPLLLEGLDRARDLCFKINRCRPSDLDSIRKLAAELLGQEYENLTIIPPFYCDYGMHIKPGRNCFINYNCVFLDEALITLGDFCFIAPNCCFSTVGHPIDAKQRRDYLEIAKPITIGDDVWIGSGVNIVPGVTIGSGTIIGAGSTVTKDIPPGVIAAGSPCRVLRPITEDDKRRYPFYPGDEELYLKTGHI